MNNLIVFLGLCFLAHFVGDFVYIGEDYSKRLLEDKQTLRYKSGMIAIHAFAYTVCIFVAVSAYIGLYHYNLDSEIFFLCAFIICLSHYVIDTTKTMINLTIDLEPSKSGYWIIFGIDQLLHYVIILIIAKIFLT